MADEVIYIGSRLELFIDDYLLDKIDGTELRLHKPTPGAVAIVHDQPWEGNTCSYHTVFQDGDGFKMYYRGSHFDEKTERGTHQVVCYAESRDGIHWTKPDLGLVEFNGSKNNNIIWDGMGSHNFAPFQDSNPDCQSEARYKALASHGKGLYAFKSPDGIHWSLLHDRPVITKGAFDSQNQGFWDAICNQYREYHREFKADERVRDIMTCNSSDFIHWTDPVWLEYPGAPVEHLYTNQILPYYRAPHIFMGFPKRFVPSRVAVEHRYGGVSDALFMTSRDGRHFKRWGEALIRPGLQKERWVNRNNFIARGILETQSDLPGTPNELSLYSIEGYYCGNSCQMRRFTLRLDGFVSLQAPLSGGEVVTRPLRFSGRELVINFSTSGAGSVWVEIQTALGIPIEGFSLAQAEEIYGDEIERVVTWKGCSDVSKLAGQPVRLRFVMKDADLYSMRFRDGSEA